MKKIFIFIILFPLISLVTVNGQQKAAKSTKRKLRLIVKPIPKPKIEIEDWKLFESAALKFRVNFPKEPTIAKAEIDEVLTKAKSTIHQSYVNQIYYMLEVREYPEGFLDETNDLSLNYGEWMKMYVLNGIKIHSEKVFDFGGYAAIEFIYQQTKNDLLIHRSYVVRQNLYQQIIQLEIKKSDTLEQTVEKNKEKINKFLDSFNLIDDQTDDKSIG